MSGSTQQEYEPEAKFIKVVFNKMRSNNSYKNHPRGLELLEATMTGKLDGTFIEQQEIAEMLGVTESAVSQRKDMLLGMRTDIKDIDLKREHAKQVTETQNTLKDVAAADNYESAAEPSGPSEPALSESNESNGSLDTLEVDDNGEFRENGRIKLIKTSGPTRTMAIWHRTVLETSMEEYVDLVNADYMGSCRKCGGYCGHDDSAKINNMTKLMTSIRPYIGDWIELFGTLDQTAATDVIQDLKEVPRRTIEFLMDKDPKLVPEYIEWMESGSKSDSKSGGDRTQGEEEKQ